MILLISWKSKKVCYNVFYLKKKLLYCNMYNTIKSVLRNHIKKNINTVWQWDIKDKNFICVFNKINDSLPIYTPQQLLEILEKEKK